MKSSRFELYHWHTRNGKDIIDVDWPKVHKTVGVDLINWINKQPKEKCQLVVDKLNNDFKLMAEFYDQQTLVAYHLMWAK
jgi:hypothetical protein